MSLPDRVLYRLWALPALLCLAASAQAQTAPGQGAAPVLTSPVPGGAALPQGSGLGYHSPESPIAPLPQRSDVLAWPLLTDLAKRTTKIAVRPQFNTAQKALHQTVQRIQGFMLPLDAKATQTHFLLTAVPLTCSFCIPGGPESMVEVRAKTPVRHSLEPVVVEGRFVLLNHDPYGLFYRMVDAVPVK
ncbi:MAG: DUF3299 domain-containing protein [Giesbergeria sp.]